MLRYCLNLKAVKAFISWITTSESHCLVSQTRGQETVGDYSNTGKHLQTATN